MSELSSHRLIRRCTISGLVAILVVIVIPLFVGIRLRNENARYVACERHERIDCEPSVVWLLMK